MSLYSFVNSPSLHPSSLFSEDVILHYRLESHTPSDLPSLQ